MSRLKRWGPRRVVFLIAGLALLLCCGGTLVWYAVDTGLRAAGALPTYTPSPTATPRPTATIKPTRTSRPTATIKPTRTSRPPTNTPLPPTATDAQTVAVEPTVAATPAPSANAAGNLRAGPGTGFDRVGSVTSGQPLQIVGRTDAGDWYVIASGAWIAALLVANAPEVPVAANIPAAPAPTVAVRSVAGPTPRGRPAASASACDCSSGNTLNCDDFDPWAAQSCYLRCMEVAGRDVHGLDGDNDGSACEWKD